MKRRRPILEDVAWLLAVALLALWLAVAMTGCGGDATAVRDDVPPPPPPPPLDYQAEIARLQSLLGEARANAAAESARADAAARAARVAAVQSAANWTAGIGALVGLIAAAAWLAAIWLAIPIGRTVLGGVAAAGLALSALALSVGELVPWVIAVGPWLVVAAAAGAAGWIAWRLVAAGRATAAAGNELEHVDPARVHVLDEIKGRLVSEQERAGVLHLVGWLRGKTRAEVDRAVQRLKGKP